MILVIFVMASGLDKSGHGPRKNAWRHISGVNVEVLECQSLNEIENTLHIGYMFNNRKKK